MQPTTLRSIPTWILVVTGLFALLELMVSMMLVFSPVSVVNDLVDLGAKGVTYVIYMWAARQFALGIILAFATFKKSRPMLILAYVFFLVMFLGDLVIGIWQKNNSMIIASLLMCLIASAMQFAINRSRP